jgi:type III pantothenate kinase
LILAIDIGNSITHLAVYERNKIVYLRKFPTLTKFKKRILLTVSKNFKNNLRCAGIASVVPELDKQWAGLINNIFFLKPLFISNKIFLPIRLNVQLPNKLGADRICNAAAGYKFFKMKENVIAVDFGTAITYDIVLSSGNYLGGIISPGIETMAKSLHSFTSKLPMLKSTDMVMPKNVIGKNTIDAIRSGTLYSALASFEGLIEKIESELKSKFKIVLTGGFAGHIHSSTKFKTVIRENLVLDGINHILWCNNGT